MNRRIYFSRNHLVMVVVLLLIVPFMNAQTVRLIPSVQAAAMDVTTDKTLYSVGELVTIYGHALPDSLVGLQVTNPVGGIIFLVGVQANSSAIYLRTFRMPVDAMIGTYTVNADGLVSTFQVVKESTTTTPTTTTTTVPTTTTITTTIPTTTTITVTGPTTTTTTVVPTTTTTTTTVPTTTTVTQPSVVTTTTATTTATSTTTVTTTTTSPPEQVSLLGNPYLIGAIIAIILIVGVAAFFAGRRM
jgi:hypothetical protein